MNIQDKIMQDYYDFIQREGKVPNELHIPERNWDEFEQIIQRGMIYWKSDPLGKIKQLWYMGMRVFNEIFSFGVGWSEETAKIKQVEIIASDSAG